MIVTDNGIDFSMRRCYRLSCEGCWPLVVVRRGLALKEDIGKEAETVWYGLVPSSTRSAISTFKGRNDGVKTTTAIYHGTDVVAVLASANVTPSQPYLHVYSVTSAIEQWIGYGIDHRLKKMYSDWNYKPSSSVEHLFSGPTATINQIAAVCRLSKGEMPEDVDALRRKVYAVAMELNQAEDDYP